MTKGFAKPYKLSSRYKLKYPEKYIGKIKDIEMRSSWELRMAKWFDENDSVLFWNSESVIVPYFWEGDGKMHKYYIDFVAKMKLKDGTEKIYAIEVKPLAQMMPPKPSRNKKRLLEETLTWTKNQAKWKAAREFFSTKGAHFIVVNEKDLGIG